jgi:hypothetical protein
MAVSKKTKRNLPDGDLCNFTKEKKAVIIHAMLIGTYARFPRRIVVSSSKYPIITINRPVTAREAREFCYLV